MDNTFNTWKVVEGGDKNLFLVATDAANVAGLIYAGPSYRAELEWIAQRLNYAANAEARFAQIGAAYPVVDASTPTPPANPEA